MLRFDKVSVKYERYQRARGKEIFSRGRENISKSGRQNISLRPTLCRTELTHCERC